MTQLYTSQLRNPQPFEWFEFPSRFRQANQVPAHRSFCFESAMFTFGRMSSARRREFTQQVEEGGRGVRWPAVAKGGVLFRQYLAYVSTP